MTEIPGMYVSDSYLGKRLQRKLERGQMSREEWTAKAEKKWERELSRPYRARQRWQWLRRLVKALKPKRKPRPRISFREWAQKHG